MTLADSNRFLAKNFSLVELTKSEYATRKGIPNIPGEKEIANLTILCDMVLQPARNCLGPIKINSGYRCKKVNKGIGGSKTSQHMEGRAADFEMDSMDNKSIFLWLALKSQLMFDQLIYEFGEWIHVSYTNERPNRNQLLHAKKVARPWWHIKRKPKTVYITLPKDKLEEYFKEI